MAGWCGFHKLARKTPPSAPPLPSAVTAALEAAVLVSSADAPGPVFPSHPSADFSLKDVAIAFMLVDTNLIEFASVMSRYARAYPNLVFYSDTITVDAGGISVVPCCGEEALGNDIVNAQYKLEKTFADFHRRFPSIF